MSEDITIKQEKERNFKYYANLAITENVKDTTARDIIRYVMECELWGQDIINPTNEYLTKRFGWKASTTRVAVSLAKKSEFISTTGSAKSRTFELNVSFLKGKIAEIVVRSARPSLMLPNELPSISPNELPNKVPNISPNKSPNTLSEENPFDITLIQENRGDNNSNNNINNNFSERDSQAHPVPVKEEVKWQPIVNYFYQSISPSVPHAQRFRKGVKEGALHLLSLHGEEDIRKAINLLARSPDRKFTPNFFKFLERVDSLLPMVNSKPATVVAAPVKVQDQSFINKILYGK